VYNLTAFTCPIDGMTLHLHRLSVHADLSNGGNERTALARARLSRCANFKAGPNPTPLSIRCSPLTSESAGPRVKKCKLPTPRCSLSSTNSKTVSVSRACRALTSPSVTLVPSPSSSTSSSSVRTAKEPPGTPDGNAQGDLQRLRIIWHPSYSRCILV
jgi:hypothetical protein